MRAQQKKDAGPVTAKLFEDMMLKHARMTKPVNSADSYQALARRVGYHALFLFIVWMAIGSPGYPGLADEVLPPTGQWIGEHDGRIFIGLATFVSLFFFGQSRGSDSFYRSRIAARWVTEWPFDVFGTLVRLGGVAVIGACAVVLPALLLQFVT